MTPFRIKLLTRLRDAGEAGLPLLISREAELWQSHQIVEIYTDPSRVLCERVRLTEFGRRYAAALCPNPKRGISA